MAPPVFDGRRCSGPTKGASYHKPMTCFKFASQRTVASTRDASRRSTLPRCGVCHAEEKLGPAAIARRLGIGRASVYRVLGRQPEPAAAVATVSG